DHAIVKTKAQYALEDVPRFIVRVVNVQLRGTTPAPLANGKRFSRGAELSRTIKCWQPIRRKRGLHSHRPIGSSLPKTNTMSISASLVRRVSNQAHIKRGEHCHAKAQAANAEHGRRIRRRS